MAVWSAECSVGNFSYGGWSGHFLCCFYGGVESVCFFLVNGGEIWPMNVKHEPEPDSDSHKVSK